MGVQSRYLWTTLRNVRLSPDIKALRNHRRTFIKEKQNNKRSFFS